MEVSEAEAAHFACSLINVGSNVILHETGVGHRENSLVARLREWGYQVTELALGEFLRGGAGAKSLALRLSDVRVTHGVKEG